MRLFVGYSIAGVVRLNCQIAWRCLANSPQQSLLLFEFESAKLTEELAE
jgi:hypothetical protein